VATDGRRDPSWDEAEVEEFRGFLSRAARIFAPGTMVAENLKRDFGVRRPVDVIFTMAPDETGSRPGGPRYRAPSDFGPVRFGILCRFSDEKGIPHILEALSRYRERHGDVHFTFAGDGERRGLIEEYVAQRDLPHVRIVPVRSPIEALDPIDVFVHPSLSEAMPVSIVEALMCGRPCIGTRVGGIPDLIRDGVEGFLIQPGSAPAILDAMERFNVMVGEERLAFQKRARARYENVCRPEKVGQVLAEHYRQIMTGGGGR
jgi:glycosyltransferase involved in cell wall biosynthesis